MSTTRATSLDNLLLDNPITYYWLGFLLADAHLSTDGDLTLEISSLDRKHLEKFAEFVGVLNIRTRNRGKYGMSTVCLRCSTLIPQLMKKFGIQDRKTYNPPTLPKLTDELLFSLIVGVIDGDGCIRKRKTGGCALHVQMHGSWVEVLNDFKQFLNRRTESTNNNSAYLTTAPRSLANFDVTDQRELDIIKREAVRLSLPLLSRKWNQISDNAENKFQLAFKRKQQAVLLKQDGMTQSQIATKLGVSPQAVYKMLKS